MPGRKKFDPTRMKAAITAIRKKKWGVSRHPVFSECREQHQRDTSSLTVILLIGMK
jgi:hypothetical protein